jgi:hypothetical protein
MPWRFRRFFGLGPFRWSLNKTGIGWSIGIPGIRYGISPAGQRHISIGIPGTGLYWVKYFTAARFSSQAQQQLNPPTPSPSLPGNSSGPTTGRLPWWKQKGLGD